MGISLRQGDGYVNILVLIKQVPDLVEELEIDATGKGLDRQRLRYVVNEFDEHALEQALLLKETHGGQVSVLALAAGEVDETLFTAIAKGADRAFKITGEQPDSHTAAIVFHNIVKTMDHDLILTGVQAVDDLDGQLGPLLAATLGLPYVGVVTGVTLNEQAKTCAVLKEYPGGLRAELEVSLPAVLGIQAAEKPPRYVPMGRLRQVMKSARIEELPSGEVAPVTGLLLRRIFKPEPAGRAEIITGATEEIVKRMVQILGEKGLLQE